MIRFILAFKNNIGNEGPTIPSTDIIVSGAGTTEVNGTYKLQDASVTGVSRVWKSDNDHYIYGVTRADGAIEWGIAPFVNTSLSDHYDSSMYNSSSNENPWGTTWYPNAGAGDTETGEGIPTVTLASGGSGSAAGTATSTDIIVSGHSNPDVNGTYKLVDESATGYDRQWVKDGNTLLKIYSCHSEGGHDWVLDFGNDGYVCGSGLEIGIDNPVDVQTWFDVNGWGTPPKFEWTSGSGDTGA